MGVRSPIWFLTREAERQILKLFMWHAINWHILIQQRSCKDKQTEKKINIAEFILEYLKQKQKIYIFK